jgi:tetratricopeptide (TPR) repeat protein
MAASATRRKIIFVVGMLGVAAVVAVGWQVTRAKPRPDVAPPEIQVDGVDPLVVAAVHTARHRVLDDPQSASAWGEFGKLLLAHGFDSEADVCFREAGQLDPDDGRWPYYRGLYAASRDPRLAVSYFRQAVAGRQPEPGFTTVARLRLAETLLDKGDVDEAERLFKVEADSSTEVMRARAAYGLGLVAVARGDSTGAGRYLTAAAASPFARTRASAQLARIARSQGDSAAAGRYEEAATRPPPDRAWPDPFVAEANRLRVGQQETLQKSDALVRRGRPAEAAELLIHLSNDSPNEQTLQATGAVLIQVGNFAQAEQALQGCLAIDPTHPQAHHLLAMAYFLHGEATRGRGDEKGARELFRKAADHGLRATERKPDFASAYLYRGRALHDLGDFSGAIAALRKAVECRPEVADSHLYLGQALAAAGRIDEARASLKIAVELADPKDPRPKAALAKLDEPK